MAWNDPFETLVDSIVEDLGTFLQEEENLELMTVMQTQEICRDFCNFLCKDVHKATPRDYTVYTQLHAFTPEEEEEYAVKLGYIKAFCEATQDKKGESATQVNVNEKHPFNSVSIKERALMRERRATQSFDANGFRIDELMMMSEQDEEALNAKPEKKESAPAPKLTSGLIAIGKTDLRPKDLSIQELEKATQATPKKPLKAVGQGDLNNSTHPGLSETNLNKVSADTNFNKVNADTNLNKVNADTNLNKVNADTNLNNVNADTNLNKVSASDSLDMLVSKAKNRANQADVKNLLEKLEDSNDVSDFRHFSLNPNESLAIPVHSDTYQRVANEIGEQKNQASEQKNQENAESKKDEVESADFMRGVEGVNYDFSLQNIRKMREFEKKQAKKMQLKDTGESLTDEFRPYMFDSKYLIDIPIPNAAEMSPVKVSLINRYLFPLAPAIVAFAFAFLMLTLSAIVGLLLLLVGGICVAAVLADIKPAPQQTPQAAIMSYLNARQGRCYGCAMSLLAQSGKKQQPIDLHAIWQPENAWPAAIKMRFRPEPPPETRIVATSAKKDAQLLFYMVGATYYLVPMVQIDGKWYITNPKLPPHEMA